MRDDEKRWEEISKLAQTEKDPQKLVELAQEIIRLLQAKRERRKSEPPEPE